MQFTIITGRGERQKALQNETYWDLGVYFYWTGVGYSELGQGQAVYSGAMGIWEHDMAQSKATKRIGCI